MPRLVRIRPQGPRTQGGPQGPQGGPQGPGTLGSPGARPRGGAWRRKIVEKAEVFVCFLEKCDWHTGFTRFFLKKVVFSLVL